MATNIAKFVVLDQPSHWESWLFIVKTLADGGNVWEYINPDLEMEPQTPLRPAKPAPTDVNPDKTSIVELDSEEKDTFKLLLAMYKDDLSIANRVTDVLQSIRNHIVTTVSINNIVYINNKTSIYQMLVALKK